MFRILENSGTIKELKTRTASFNLSNKWNQEEGRFQKYRIFMDENKKIVWIGVYFY